MSNFNGHLLFQADRLSCSYLNPPGGTNFYGVPEGSKSTEVVDHSVYAYFDIHVHV